MTTERERQLLAWIAENPLISQLELAEKAGITRSSVAVHISNLMKKGYIQGKGYILQTSPYVVVIGAVNMDIHGSPAAALVPGDSNPGTVRMSLGGVGRNIAHNLTLLGIDTKFFTVFGEDIYAKQIAQSCRDLGIDISHSHILGDCATSTYLFITNPEGDMELAISDMDIYAKFTPDLIESKLDIINNASVCVVDCNLPQETLEYIAHNCTSPIFADPVSTAKATKLRGILDKIHTLKPNRIEAELLTGIEVQDDRSARRAVEALLAKGIKQVFLSLGSDGVMYGCAKGIRHLENYPAQIRNTSGAGDSFMSALVMSHLREFSTEKAARCGLAAASIVLASDHTVSDEMDSEAILKIVNKHN